MLFLIVIILVVGLLIYYVWNLPFEEGDGFTEMKKNIREVEYSVTDKEKKNIMIEDKGK